MKRAIAATMVLGMIVGMVGTAEAGKKKKPKAPVKVTREAQGTYTSTNVVAAGNCTQTDAVNCPRIATGATEAYFTATVTDTSGLPVPVAVKADKDGDGATETLYGAFCGGTAEPIQFDPGVELTFWIGVSPDTASLGCAGVASTGTVDVVLSNLP